MSKFCINCGKEMAEEDNVCGYCGTPANGNIQNELQEQPVANSIPYTQQAPTNGMAIAGLIISISSLILCCGSLSWLSLIFSIIGMSKAKDIVHIDIVTQNAKHDIYRQLQ